MTSEESALVLQGGGALGAYELGVVRRLYRDFRPDIITGVSIGAITAAILAGARNGDPVATLETLWQRFTVSNPLMPGSLSRFSSLLGNPHFFRARNDYVNFLTWTNFYDTAPLRETLLDLVDFASFEDPNHHPRLIITATDVTTGNIKAFNSKVDHITVDHVLASGALPPGFPFIRIDGSVYWDGGLFDNTPLRWAIEAFDGSHANPNIRRRIFVANLFPDQGSIPENMLDCFGRMFEIIFSNKIAGDVDMLKRINEYVEAVNAINEHLPSGSPIRNLPGYQRILEYRLIQRIDYITNTDPVSPFAPFDFSEESIRKRAQSGYDDTDRVLRRC